MNLLSNIPAFLLMIGVLVVVHEYGHYRVAVACGVKVLRFSVGFGRVLWRRQASPEGTEFVLCLLPLGGYVKMLDEREAPVAPNELGRAFNRKSLLQRVAIVAAGPIANLLLAVVLYATTNWIGVDEAKAVMASPVAGSLADKAGLHSGDWVREWSADGAEWHELRSMTDLRWEITQAVVRGQPLQLTVTDRAGHARRTVSLALQSLGSAEVDPTMMQRIGLGYPFREPVLGEVKTGEPGARAGLRSGDRVIAIDGVAMADAFAVRDAIRTAVRNGAVQAMLWRVERAGQSLEIAVTPSVVGEGAKQIGRIGVDPGQPHEMVNVRYGPIEGLTNAASQTWQMSTLTLKMLGKMIIGQASLKNLSGPITIADVAGQSMRLGVAYYLGVMAVVSIGLGVLNLLPLPVLDGGHLMYYLFEGVTGKPVSELWLDRLQRGGVAIMLMMMSLALYNDVARLLGLQ